MRQISTQRAFFEPAREFASSADPRVVDLNHLLLLAIGRALSPPIVHMRSTLQPMRVIVVEPDLCPPDNSADEAGYETPHLLPLALPQVAGFPNHYDPELHQRVVQGEILSDESGKLYEKLGRQIRPIHQLASGPFGELIDLVPVGRSNVRMLAPPAGPRLVEAKNTVPSSFESGSGNGGSSVSKFVPLQESTEKSDVSSYRKLFLDPGQWRVVSWGEFREILARQLAHPERLRDTYRLPCYVQVIEINREMSIEELAASHPSEKERQSSLYFLTSEIAAKLDLVSLLPPLAAPEHGVRRKPNTLLPHDRVFSLLAANDPTVDVATFKTRAQSPASNAASQSSDAKAVGEETAHKVALKMAIPERFVKEWEFKLTREEASYDISRGQTLAGAIQRFFRRLRIFKLRSEFRKWHVLLSGKTADEQLWSVRPPADMMAHPFIREWATRTLSLAGYDPQKMILEWE